MFARLLNLSALLVLLGCMFAPPLSTAQSYPQRPVRLEVGFPAGSTIDIVGRIVGQKLSDQWRQPVVVENRAGATGNIATELVAKATPDGYTLLTANNGLAVSAVLSRNLPFNARTDLTPLVQLSTSPHVLVVPASLPVNSVQELIKLARSQPGAINFASSGNGSADHMAAELFKSVAKLDIVHVPYKGSPQALSDLAAGQVTFYLPGIPAALPLLKAGKIKALGISGTRRSAMAGDLPLLSEAGLPGMDATIWYGIFVPARTPREIVARLNADINHALSLREVQDRFLGLGMEAVGGSSAEFTRFFQSELDRWAKFSAATGFMLE
jgi:tripartite-type tricarboxylate transporter receptor subunit TctC